jgi:hypothetical protein
MRGADAAARARLKRPTGAGCQGNLSCEDIENQTVLASLGVTVEAVKERSFSQCFRVFEAKSYACGIRDS